MTDLEQKILALKGEASMHLNNSGVANPDRVIDLIVYAAVLEVGRLQSIAVNEILNDNAGESEPQANPSGDAK